MKPPVRHQTRLPNKFTKDERAAYRHLWDCGMTGWLVDFVTKKVHALDERCNSIEFTDLIAARAAFDSGEWRKPKTILPNPH